MKTDSYDYCMKDKTASTPDLELIGHEDDAEFALGMCSSEPLVASGGKDKNVCFLPPLPLLLDGGAVFEHHPHNINWGCAFSILGTIFQHAHCTTHAYAQTTEHKQHQDPLVCCM